MYGIREFNGLINPPQSALLAVGEIRERPFVDQGVVGIRPEMSLTLAADHRVVDGAEAARFLDGLRKSLTPPVTPVTGNGRVLSGRVNTIELGQRRPAGSESFGNDRQDHVGWIPVRRGRWSASPPSSRRSCPADCRCSGFWRSGGSCCWRSPAGCGSRAGTPSSSPRSRWGSRRPCPARSRSDFPTTPESWPAGSPH